MSKIVILSFSEDEKEVCQRILQILGESPHFEGCNMLQVEKHLSIGGTKVSNVLTLCTPHVLFYTHLCTPSSV